MTDIIVILHYGKVGSNSIFHALKEVFGESPVQAPGNKIVYAHSLSLSQPHASYHLVPSSVALIHETLEKIRVGHPIKVITPIRNPLSRNISWFFNYFELHWSKWGLSLHSSMDEIAEVFLSEFDHDYVLDFFDTEVKENLGIDVYAQDFPAAGFCTYRKDNIELLVFKVAISDEEKGKLVGDFLGMLPLEIKRLHASNAKPYAELYQRFCREWTVPKEYQERIFSSKFYKHFWGNQ